MDACDGSAYFVHSRQEALIELVAIQKRLMARGCISEFWPVVAEYIKEEEERKEKENVEEEEENVEEEEERVEEEEEEEERVEENEDHQEENADFHGDNEPEDEGILDGSFHSNASDGPVLFDVTQDNEDARSSYSSGSGTSDYDLQAHFKQVELNEIKKEKREQNTRLLQSQLAEMEKTTVSHCRKHSPNCTCRGTDSATMHFQPFYLNCGIRSAYEDLPQEVLFRICLEWRSEAKKLERFYNTRVNWSHIIPISDFEREATMSKLCYVDKKVKKVTEALLDKM